MNGEDTVPELRETRRRRGELEISVMRHGGRLAPISGREVELFVVERITLQKIVGYLRNGRDPLL